MRITANSQSYTHTQMLAVVSHTCHPSTEKQKQEDYELAVSLGEVVSPTHPPKATAAANTYRYLTIQDSD